MRRLVFAFLFFSGATALAQVRETTTVEVVEVPVYVAVHGEPVASLTRDNFELYVNGKRRAVDYFDTIDYATLSPDQSRDVHQRRLYMLVFDLLSDPNALHRAQRAAVEFIDGAEENDTFGIATFGLDGMKVITPFSQDRLLVRRAIRNMQTSRIGDPLHLALSGSERGEELGRPDRMNDPRFVSSSGEQLEPLDLIVDEIYFLGDLARRLGGMEGHKHVVLLSSGFDAVAFFGITTPQAPGNVREGPLRSFNDLHRASSILVAPPNAALLGKLKAMWQQFADAGVFLDAIDIAGLRPWHTAASNDSLYALARGTGGEVVDRRNDLAGAIHYLTNLQRVVYVLGFHAVDTGSAQNRINVKLVNVPRGARASYRPSYTSIAGQTDSADTLRLADIVSNDIPQNGISIAVAIETAPNGAGVEVAVPGRELLAPAGGDVIGMEAMLYITSGSTVVAYKVKRITVDVPRAAAALETSPIRVRESFDLPPGKYAAKILVRVDNTGALGFARRDFVIPP